MTHLPYIIVCYALGLGVPVVFALGARQRLSRAQARLAVLEVRR